MTTTIPAVDEVAPEIDPRISERRQAVARRRGQRRLVTAVVVGALVMTASGVLGALHSRLFSARHVTVHGAVHTPVAAIEAAAGLTGVPALIDFDPARAAVRAERLPWVRTATVVVHWPDAVTVTVTERAPVAVTPRPGGVALVDAAGRVLAWTDAAPPDLVSLDPPVPVGRPGATVPGADAAALAAVVALPARLDWRVRSIGWGPDGVFVSLAGRLGACLGPAQQLAAKFAALTTLLSGATPPAPGLIDLTVPSAPTVAPLAAAPTAAACAATAPGP